MIECLNPEQFAQFLNLVFQIVERVGETYVLHTTGSGDVVWSFNETSQLWCTQ